MKDLTPLFETSESARTRALLQAGRVDLPPAGFSDRLLVGLGVGVAVSSVSVTAAATASASGAASMGSGATGLGLVAAKWVAVGVIGGGILASGADLALTPKRAAPAEPGAVEPQREAKSPSPAATPAPPAVASAQPAGAPILEAEAGEGPVIASERGRLARDVQLIDRARRALAAGEAARALAELDELERRATSGVLDREAWILRIEALHLSGQVGRARQLAVRYREAFPNDAHAARLRVLEEEKP